MTILEIIDGMITIDSEVGKQLGFTAKWRIQKGWTVEAAFRTPVRAKRSARQGGTREQLGEAP